MFAAPCTSRASDSASSALLPSCFRRWTPSSAVRSSCSLVTATRRYLASGDSGGLVRLWEGSSGAFVAEFQGHDEKVDSVNWTRDDKFVVSFSQGISGVLTDGTVEDLAKGVSVLIDSAMKNPADDGSVLTDGTAEEDPTEDALV